ncbi:MAG: dihydrolipoamide acetyltransferase family protein [Actinomycetota bacterium]
MSDLQHFRLPDVGEGLTEAEIVSWRVKVGDVVRTNDVLVEIETAKSLVELPSPYAGTVAELLVAEGQTVAVGTPIIAVLPVGAAAPPAQPATDLPAALPGVPAAATEVEVASADVPVEPGLIGGPAPGGRTSVLVGYGPRTTSAVRRPRKANVDSLAEGRVKPQRHGGFEIGRIVEQRLAEEADAPRPEPHRRQHQPAHDRVATGAAAGAHGQVLAKPPVRKLAKDLGIDLRDLTPTGPLGRLTRDDVLGAGATAPAEATSTGSARETRVAVKGVRRATAEAMVASAFTAPHVTEFVTVDVTRTMKLVERLRTHRDFADVKVSPLLLVAKALLISVRRNPGVNASWDAASGEIVIKHYVNLGIAAATPRGLVVPNVKDAETLSLHARATALGELVATAREGRTQPEQMARGTISITNVGVFGVDTGTPILPPGEAVILAFGAVRAKPWVHKGKVVPRQVTTLALSFDHRMVDGDLGSRFLADVAAVLERPDTALLWA